MLNKIKKPRGANKKPKIVGRGIGSGHGKRCCRGQKGQLSRTGHKVWPGFEGGQMPLIRRIPKRGFNNKFKKEFQVVNLESILKLKDITTVDPKFLKEQNLIKKENGLVKILGRGEEIKKPLTIKAHAFSHSSKEKIEKAGGVAEIIS